MFSDLVGSTALSARMDPEDLREVISAYQKCVAETVQRFGGFVAKYMPQGSASPRLQAVAEPNGVVIAEGTRKLLGNLSLRLNPSWCILDTRRRTRMTQREPCAQGWNWWPLSVL